MTNSVYQHIIFGMNMAKDMEEMAHFLTKHNSDIQYIYKTSPTLSKELILVFSKKEMQFRSEEIINFIKKASSTNSIKAYMTRFNPIISKLPNRLRDTIYGFAQYKIISIDGYFNKKVTTE